MSSVPQLAQIAIDHARRGDFARALEFAKDALSMHPRDHGLMLFVGMLQTRRMELDQAVITFKAALRLKPTDQLTRIELTRVLIAVNQLDQAEKLLSKGKLPGLEPKRLAGLIAIRRGQAARAVQFYREIVAEESGDFESWGNLGVALLASGDAAGAVSALRSSLHLRREQQRFRDKWAEAHVAAGTGEEGLAITNFWSQCRSILPMIVHLVRYERLVDDAEAEMRALLAFLGLEWTDSVLDNRAIARDRGFISTPSYSQVVEPLYDRSIGRWERYREQMKPVLPMLEPWANRMGYEV